MSFGRLMRSRLLWGTLVVAALAAGLWAGVSYARAGIEPLGPKPGAATNQAATEIRAHLGEATHGLRVVIDGRDITDRATIDDGHLRVSGLKLPDGAHRVVVRSTTGGPIRRTVRRSWEFTVDTVRPTLEAETPEGPQNAKRLHVAGTTEPGASVAGAVRGHGATRGTADASGAFAVDVPLREGVNVVALTATDAAGNRTRLTRRVVRDTRAPRIVLADLPHRLAAVAPKLRGVVSDAGPAGMAVTTTVAVDGTPTEATPAVAPDGSWVVRAGALSEGGHTIKVTATDTAGNAATVSRAVLVDSTEQLGDRPVGPGAVGADVAELIDFLRDEKAYTGPAGRRYTVRVARAVRALQRKNQIEPTGVADRDTLSLLVGRIEVDLSEFRLSLVRGKRVIKSYSIATGSWDHPTPTGSYEIITKEVDPTWNPPDSPWAEGLGPIPPGPGNPLGTRWIGTSAPAIGIHGTYADYSIGTPASHGCMRMHISDVEDLYERVEVGMPVEIHE